MGRAAGATGIESGQNLVAQRPSEIEDRGKGQGLQIWLGEEGDREVARPGERASRHTGRMGVHTGVPPQREVKKQTTEG